MLGEGRKICRQFRLAEVNDYGAILPRVVMIVVVIDAIVQERRFRSLVHVDIVNAKTVRVLAAENVDIGVGSASLADQA